MEFCVHCGAAFQDAATRFCTTCGRQREQPPRSDSAQPGTAQPEPAPTETTSPEPAQPEPAPWASGHPGLPPLPVATTVVQPAIGAAAFPPPRAPSQQTDPPRPQWQPQAREPLTGRLVHLGSVAVPLWLVSLVVIAVAAGGITSWLLLKPPSAQAGAPAASLSSTPSVVTTTESQPNPTPTASPSPPPSSPSPSPSPSPSSADTSLESSQLSSFAAVLADSAAARGRVASTVAAVGACEQDPETGASTLTTAASTRQADASSLQSLPVDAVPGGETLSTDLAALLNDSAQADQDYAQWMQDIESQGCPVDTTTDPAYQQGDLESQTATTEKQAFLAIWNPLAAQFALPTYTADKL